MTIPETSYFAIRFVARFPIACPGCPRSVDRGDLYLSEPTHRRRIPLRLARAGTEPETLERSMKRARGDGGNGELIYAIARDVMPAIRWLQAHGVRFIRATPDPHQRFVLAPPAPGRTGNGWRTRRGRAVTRSCTLALREQSPVGARPSRPAVVAWRRRPRLRSRR